MACPSPAPTADMGFDGRAFTLGGMARWRFRSTKALGGKSGEVYHNYLLLPISINFKSASKNREGKSIRLFLALLPP